jgi:hypothetical protein
VGFTDLYTKLGLVDGSGLNLGAFEFAGSTISTTDSTAIVIDQATTITSNLSVGGDILPQTAHGGDLGSSTLPWRSLYVSNNTIFIGGVPLGIDANGNLTVSGTLITGGGSGSSLVNGANTVSLDSDGKLTLPNGSTIGDVDSFAGVPITTARGTILLGNSPEIGQADHFHIMKGGQQALDLFLGDDSNYVKLPDAGGVEIATQNFNQYSWTFGTDGHLTIPGDIKSNGNINIDINLSDSTLHRWQFGEDGELTLPGGRTRIGTTVDSDAIIANEDEVFGVIAQGTNGAVHLMWIEDLENAYTSNLAAVYINSGGPGSVRIATGANSGPGPNYWEFNNSGALTFPQGTTFATTDETGAFIIDGAADKDVQIYTYSGETARGWTFGTDGSLTLPGDIKSNSNINIDINLSDSTLRRWQFGEDGDLTLPAGGNISEGGGFTGAIRLTPAGGANANQALLIYPTGTAEGDHIHLTAGGGSTELYLGDDFHFVKLVNGGNVEVRANNGVNDAAWTFGTDGKLALPSNGKIASGVSTAQVGSTTTIALNDQGTNQAYDVTYLGIAWTGNEAVFTTYAAGSTITFANGDVRTINDIQKNEVYDSPGEFVIDIYWSASRANLTAFPITLKTANYAAAYTAPEWQFGTNGDLEIPGNIKSEGNINIDINLADSTLRRWQFGEDGDLETPGGIQVAGILKIDDGVHEKFQTKADATGIVTHDCSLGHIFYHTSPDALFTVNFTNLNLSSGYATALTLIIVQGGTGFIPNSVGIGGVIQTLNWQGNVTPTPSTNRTDVVTFSIICTATDTYTVLGQLTGF